MNALAFYFGCLLYFYFRFINNTEMITYSFHIAVLLGILATLNRR